MRTGSNPLIAPYSDEGEIAQDSHGTQVTHVLHGKRCQDQCRRNEANDVAFHHAQSPCAA